MHDDIPAATPLIATIAGLACAGILLHPSLTAGALVLCAVLWRRARVALLFAALGLFLAVRMADRRAAELRAFRTFPAEQFVTIEAPLERDWTPRGLLRASRFRANGVEFDEPLLVFVRFDPPPIAMQTTLRAEGFLRRGKHHYSLSVKSPHLMTYEGELARWKPSSWNRMLANRLRPHAKTHPVEVTLVEALVLGRSERLTSEIRDSFKRGGTYHLLVFSGMQIAFAAGLLAMLLRWFHRPRISDWLLLGFAALAPLFIGPTASVSRASIGLGLYALSRLLKRPTSVENLWCVAALLRLLLEPRDLTDASFHLTYAGAGALLFLAKKRHWLVRLLSTELAITPLTLFHFHQYALGGSLLTLAMSPLIFAMLIVSIVACVTPAPAVFDAVGALHRLCAAMNVVGVSGFFHAPPLWAMVAGAGLSLVALNMGPMGRIGPMEGMRGVARRRRQSEVSAAQRWRSLVIGVALLIPTCVAVTLHLTKRDVPPRITLLDVGQGDAILLREGRHAVLVDGGYDEDDVLPFLVDRGVQRLDAVVLSHPHPDHCNGLPAVLEHLEVRELWLSPRRFRGDCAQQLLPKSRRTVIRLLRDGDVRTIGAMRFTTHVADRTFRRAPENNASVILRAELGGRSLLLTGDIERDAESWFSDRDLRADLLKVPHHGSRTSTTTYLLDNVRPRVALLSCGWRNQFGHPHPTVMERLDERRIRTWRTDRGGTLDVDLAGGRVLVRQQIDTPRGEAYP
ncbi:MAG TPA: DNA internalization-related competence protein ComEC/Rec2 [Thermoanaerobaculia bacterium]